VRSETSKSVAGRGNRIGIPLHITRSARFVPSGCLILLEKLRHKHLKMNKNAYKWKDNLPTLSVPADRTTLARRIRHSKQDFRATSVVIAPASRVKN